MPSEVALSYLRWQAEAYRQLEENYKLFSDYYDGEHRAVYATADFKEAFGSLFDGFCDNVCELVVDTMCDRIKIEDFDGPYADLCREIWRRNRMDMEHAIVHNSAAVYGDSYVYVWPGPEKRKAQIWFNAPDLIRVHYDSENFRDMTFASKRWQLDDGSWRLDILTPTEVLRFKVEQRSSIPTMFGLKDIGQYWGDDAWRPLSENPVLTNSFGRVPIFHFKNKEADSTHGKSEIMSVIPQQDALNRNLVNLMLSTEFTAYPQRWATGFRPPDEGFKMGGRRLMINEDPEGDFGNFDGSDCKGLVETVELFMDHIATTSRTPRHLFTGMERAPSGEALKVVEHGLVSKVKSRHTSFGNTWQDVLAFAIYIETGTQVDPNEIIIRWSDPSPNTELLSAQTEIAKWEAIQAAAEVVGFERALISHGYSASEANKIANKTRSVVKPGRKIMMPNEPKEE